MSQGHHVRQLQVWAAHALEARNCRDYRWEQLMNALMARTGMRRSGIEARIEMLAMGVPS